MDSSFYILTLNEQIDPTWLKQAANLLMVGFHGHWPDSWADHDSAVEEVREMLAPDRIFRAAIDEGTGEIIGWIGGIPEYNGNVWELHPLVVRPDLQRRGIGRVLVKDFEEQVRTRGGITIMLGTDDEDGMTSLSQVNLYENIWEHVRNIRNLKGHPYEFYQKMGYTIIGVVPDANGLGKPDILMAKRVD